MSSVMEFKLPLSVLALTLATISCGHGLEREISSLKSWSDHMRVIKREYAAGRHVELYRAYESSRRSNEPVFICGQARVFLRWYSLSQHRLDSRPAPLDRIPVMRERLTKAAAAVPRHAFPYVTRYLFETTVLPPPDFDNAKPVIMRMKVNGVWKDVPGYEQVREDPKRVAMLAELSRKALAAEPSDPEARFIYWYRQKPSLKRYRELEQAYKHAPQRFGLSGMRRLMDAATAIGWTKQAEEWRARLRAEFEATRHSLSTKLYAKVYGASPAPGSPP